MKSTRDLRTPASLNNEARQALTAAFDAMSNWREEISCRQRTLPAKASRSDDCHPARYGLA